MLHLKQPGEVAAHDLRLVVAATAIVALVIAVLMRHGRKPATGGV
ncbi:hypothetical protein [Nocardia sp. NPDC049526]